MPSISGFTKPQASGHIYPKFTTHALHPYPELPDVFLNGLN